MPLDILHFGSGAQAIHYFVLCLVSTLGTLQAVACRYERQDLLWTRGSYTYMLSATMVVGAFTWFFWADDEIFVPGLAGGELFVLFVVAFLIAVPLTRLVAWLVTRVARSVPAQSQLHQEKEPTT